MVADMIRAGSAASNHNLVDGTNLDLNELGVSKLNDKSTKLLGLNDPAVHLECY
ncbi:MAG: hypothetical protein MHPSP_004687, partial [Paramarteilia canceri]